MEDVCGNYINSSQNYSSSQAKECAHGIGHALMYALDNQVAPSLENCRKLPEENLIEGCYKGVFMENGYLYMSFYEGDAPKPQVLGASMVDLCNGLVELEANECAKYVGDSYFAGNRADIKGAVAQCGLLEDKQKQENCIRRISSIYIPG